ncbi:putative prefoldin subunit 2 [Teratosphaeria destructans]|uniref:Prefoldin subunit 2 n=1 Tax=Teratosphaeria destructans TaxID=418781 RepID=A0A9W7VYK8_9PEZI|nr:putative prefoldin subunit 2 [Teratosphaeria destructans]
MSQQAISAKKQQELQVQYSNYKDTLQAIAQKIGDIEQETEEHKYVRPKHAIDPPPSCLGGSLNMVLLDHANEDMSRLVLETLTPLAGGRKCFRMINGVLTERTVAEVLPALQMNSDGLKKVLEDLVKQYGAKQEEMEKWKKKNNIQVVQQ